MNHETTKVPFDAPYIYKLFFRARIVNMAFGKSFKKKLKKNVKRVARTQGRVATTVGKVARTYGKAADDLGGAIQVVGMVTGQPQVAAAGAGLQKSGRVATIGGRTAVAAGRAQKKLVGIPKGQKSSSTAEARSCGQERDGYYDPGTISPRLNIFGTEIRPNRTSFWSRPQVC